MAQGAAEILVRRIDGGYGEVEALLALIAGSFAAMEGVIDPPSSANNLSVASLREKIDREAAFVATAGDTLAGCVFLADRGDHFYLGKLAVDPRFQKHGVGSLLLAAAEDHARAAGKPVIELQTRIELTANHAFFARKGYFETERTAHPGYDRVTSITWRRALS